MKYFRLGIMTMCCVALSACGLLDYFFLPPPEDTAQELYENANDAMREKDYLAAAKYFQRIKDNFPFSPYTLDAELSLGDAYYLDEDYPMAAEAYKEFETLHPGHEAIPYVLYQIGMSDLKSFRSIDRPTTMLQEAIEYFTRLIETSGDPKYAAKAPEAIAKCRALLAEHELYIGDVFWNSGRYGAAWRRSSYILDEFRDVPEIYKHVEEKSLAAYYRYREEQSRETRERVEGSWKNWFRWL
jgi:outer membrane protein assembly factor BamD